MSRHPDDPLLLVGFQRGVLPALEALGRPALLVIDRGRRSPGEHPAIQGVIEVDMHGPAAPIEEATRTLLADRRPAAIVALAERTVLVAAHLRRALDLPGNSPETALACADKVVMKRSLDAAGIPVAAWREIDRDTRAEGLVEALGLPLVIKPRRDSGGRQQRRHETLSAVESSLAELARGTQPPGYGWLAEGWIEGVEMSVETFVQEGRPVFSNPTEYYVPRHANILPAELDAETWREMRAFAERALRATGVERGITHLELFRTARGLVLGELASRPPGGRLMNLIERAWGFDPWEALLRLELGEPAVLGGERAQRIAGVWIMHPGPGTLTAIRRLDQARALPLVRRISLKVRPGDRIPERLGSGQDVCAVYAEGPTRDAVADALSGANELIRFDLA